MNDKKVALEKLLSKRDQILNDLAEIESLLQVYFSDDFSIAYQHWIPQIKTALADNTKWLPRGQYSMDYTIRSIMDRLSIDSDKGVSKYIK